MIIVRFFACAITGRIPNVENDRGCHTMKLYQLDLDGLPFVGAYLEDGDALFRYDEPVIRFWRQVCQCDGYLFIDWKGKEKWGFVKVLLHFERCFSFSWTNGIYFSFSWMQYRSESRDDWGTCLEMKSYYVKFYWRKNEGQCISGKERDYLCWVTLQLSAKHLEEKDSEGWTAINRMECRKPATKQTTRRRRRSFSYSNVSSSDSNVFFRVSVTTMPSLTRLTSSVTAATSLLMSIKSNCCLMTVGRRNIVLAMLLLAQIDYSESLSCYVSRSVKVI